MVKCAVIVVAAGRGHRLEKTTPKQYLPLNGRPVLTHCLATFCAHPAISAVRVVIHPDDEGLYAAAAKGLPVLPPVYGGAERQDSVRIGLESLKDENPDVVLIHDAARPFIDAATIDRVIRAAKTQGAIPAIPVVDTLKKADDDKKIVDTVDRSNLWRVQTPQGFPYAAILNAHEQAAGRALTDDAAVAEKAGLPVVLVDGSDDNFKITTPADFARAQQVCLDKKGDVRTGTGFDVHAFADGNGVWLCGVFVPFAKKLEGHSDADVALHALTDALLGAVGAGDIGLRFPPSDDRWKGKESSFFVQYAVDLIHGAGGRVSNVDITVICEEPKIGPHRFEMTEKIAGLLGVSPDRVNVKGTTTEKLGFTGRKEGIAAQAVATVVF